MTVLRKHVNILNGFNKVKQQTEDTSEGNMKHLKLGKIQWIALLVVSAMFVNLCSHMVLAAARDGNDPAQGTTAEATTASEATTEATTASEATTETTTEQQEETQSMGEYKAFWFSFYDYDSYRAKYKKRTAANFRTYFTGVVKKGKSLGMNRVIVQVRPFGDAIYKSKYFPWSKYISGKQGRNPGFDPLKIMVEVTHDNDMKIEAWVNPYRVTTGSTNYKKLAKNNQARKWHAKKSTRRNVLSYGGSLYYNPSKKAVRTLITNGVKEIVQNYDVDGIHMDDYFYPYPAKGMDFPDDASFARYGGGFTNRADWRRSNVNILIQKIHETIRGLKPWVKFGISPFGIYRNEKNDPLGSKTNGLQNYDDLYADVLLWARNGWVDYNIPQIYWQIGHPAADYETLVKWWAKNTENRPLFIGQSVMNTIQNADPKNPSMNQLPRKMALERAYQTIGGSCQWPASAVVENAGKYRDALVQEYHKYPALVPVFDFMDDKAPGKVRKVKKVWTEDGYMLFWTAPKAKDEMDRAVQYVVYRFDDKEKVNIDDASHIVAVTRNNFYKLPYKDGKNKYRYVVTALDRLHNESKSVSKKVKL